MAEKRARLTKILGRTDIIALGFGTMVGWGWVVLATSWINQAGFFGTILAFCIGVLIILTIGFTYGELTAALPLSGGEMVYAYRAGGPTFSWLVGWVMTLAYLGVAAWESIAMATAVNYILPIPLEVRLWDIGGIPIYLSWAGIGMIGAGIVTILNLLGTRPAIIFQVMATAGILFIAFIIFLGGISFGNIENIKPYLTSPWGFFYVLLIIPSMLIGFDVIPQSAEEMNISPRSIGKMIVVCILLSFCWYLLVIIGTGLSAPIEISSSGKIPTAEVVAYAYGNSKFATIVVATGILGILTSWNGFFMGATRLIFAMGRAKMLPSIFAKVSHKNKTPWVATLVVGITCIISPLFGEEALLWLVNISSICALFSYCCVTISFVILRYKEPELHRPIKVKGGMAFGLFVVFISFMYFAMYIFIALKDKSYTWEVWIILTWTLIGLALFIYSRYGYGKISDREREILVFGEKLARIK